MEIKAVEARVLGWAVAIDQVGVSLLKLVGAIESLGVSLK